MGNASGESGRAHSAAFPADSAIPTVSALLSEWAGRGDCLGGQIFVWVDGRVAADVAVGRSGITRTAAATDIARLYCAVKPLVACCLARAVDMGEAEFDDRASRFLPDFSSHGRASITLRQLLSHTSGLFDHTLDPYVCGFRNIVRLACKYPLPEKSWYRLPRYNDALAWNVLAAVVEVIYSASIEDVIRQLMALVPGEPGICLTAPDPARYIPCHMPRGGSYATVPEPRSEVMFETVNPAHGGFASARDLGLLYAELVSCARGGGVLLGEACAREMTRQHSVVSFGLGDDQRTCGLGFMTNVSQDGIGGGWSHHSFGHAGYVGQYRVVHAFGDPDNRVAAAMKLFSVGSKNNWRFNRLGEALWSDLRLGDGSGGQQHELAANRLSGKRGAAYVSYTISIEKSHLPEWDITPNT